MDLNELWRAALGELELTLTRANFTTWFKNTFIASFDGERVVVSAPNAFNKSWLEKKYHDPIVKALRHVAGPGVREVTYRVEIRNEGAEQPVPVMAAAMAAAPVEPTTLSFGAPTPVHTGTDFGLNPRYIFDTFVVGKANELAHAAAMAAAAQPGNSYNPVFIYGNSGLGKTHLLQAIGHHIMAQKPGAKVLYATCERFTNDFINAVRGGKGKEFKDIYRNVDALLIDDIQFMTGKEGTQEEFFHTFNEQIEHREPDEKSTRHPFDILVARHQEI
jgi:chromosomal replication initiator protein